MKSSIFALVAATGLVFASQAIAADLIVDVPAAPVLDDSGFDWEGAYVGGFLGYYPTFGDVTIGGEIGYNFLTSENILLGVEASGLIDIDGTADTEVFVRGKVGGVFDNVAIYALGGVGTYNFTTPLWDIGAGIEIAVTDSVTWSAQVFGRDAIGSLPTTPVIQTGLRFHF